MTLTNTRRGHRTWNATWALTPTQNQGDWSSLVVTGARSIAHAIHLLRNGDTSPGADYLWTPHAISHMDLPRLDEELRDSTATIERGHFRPPTKRDRAGLGGHALSYWTPRETGRVTAVVFRPNPTRPAG